MAAPASAVSGPGLGGAVRAPRSTGAQRRKRGVELPSPSLLFGRSKGSCFPRAVRVGCSGRRVAMRAAGASGWVMNPEGETDGMPSSAGAVQFEADDLQVAVIDDESITEVGAEVNIESSETTQGAEKSDVEGVNRMAEESAGDERPRVVPPPGDGQKIYQIDPMLHGYKYHLDYRYSLYRRIRSDIDQYEGGLEAFSRSYEKFGFNRSAEGITYREWAPGANSAALVGDFNNWDPNADRMNKNEFGVWEIFLPNNADGSPPIPHGSSVKVRMDTPSGIKDSIPAWIKYSVQAPGDMPYSGIYYDPPVEEKYVFKHPQPKRPKSLRIYETHIGMSSPEPKINTYANFRDEVLPRIKRLGYNAVQIMAIQEHSYYGSFGYHVTNFFAPSSRFGTPEDLKSLIDRAHELGLLVLMDVVHSHASNNTLDGLNGFDGTDTHYFHSGSRGHHWMWDSHLFNYGNWEVIRFLLSNARWWLEEYKFDGFRFDGVTSMMYTHHGLQVTFSGNYNEYFGFATDVDAVVYLMLVNDLIHGLYPEAVTIGEDVSGMPTFSIPIQDGGVGFDYRMHMAVADKWIELLKKSDQDWKMADIVQTLTNRRWLEKCVTYAESHDQALVGDKTTEANPAPVSGGGGGGEARGLPAATEMAATAKYNRSNPAVKRILQEVKEMQSNPSPDFMALPLEEDIFEWQFAILGPRDSEFEGGIYHGRIQLPSDYPFKPPSFMLLTPSGRFEVQKKICLSISNYHPEHWQPSWSVRTALVALIAFMPTNPGGALGSLDYKKEDRRALAIKSCEAPPKFGSPERQKLIDEIHEQMLTKAPPVPQLLTNGPNEDTDQLTSPDASGEHADKALEGVNTSGSSSDSVNNHLPKPDSESEVARNIAEAQSDRVTNLHMDDQSRRESIPRVPAVLQNPAVAIQKPKHDRLLTLAAFGLTLAIMALVIKKFLKINGLAGYNIEGKF